MKAVLLVLSQVIVMSAFAGGGTKVGSGSNGLYGADVQRPSGSGAVIVQPPGMSDADLVTVYEPAIAQPATFCVIVVNDAEAKATYRSVWYDNQDLCKYVNKGVMVKGDKDIAVIYEGATSFYRKHSGVPLRIRLGKISIPRDDTVANANIRVDVTDTNEQDKILYKLWTNYRFNEPIDLYMPKAEQTDYANDYRLMRKYFEFDAAAGAKLFYNTNPYRVENLGPGQTAYVLPGTYLIEWNYKNGSRNYTTGVKVLP